MLIFSFMAFLAYAIDEVVFRGEMIVIGNQIIVSILAFMIIVYPVLILIWNIASLFIGAQKFGNLTNKLIFILPIVHIFLLGIYLLWGLNQDYSI